MTSFNLFRTLGVAPTLGSGWTRSDDGTRVFSVVLSYDAWQRRFRGDSGIVGKAVMLDDYAYTVLGILPKGFAFPEGARSRCALSRGDRGVRHAELHDGATARRIRDSWSTRCGRQRHYAIGTWRSNTDGRRRRRGRVCVTTVAGGFLASRFIPVIDGGASQALITAVLVPSVIAVAVAYLPARRSSRVSAVDALRQ